MDISSTLAGINTVDIIRNAKEIGINSSYGQVGSVQPKDGLSPDGSLFSVIFNSAVDNLKTTNNYLSDAENEKIKWALGETDNAHDLTIAMSKASTALSYTVAIRDKMLEAYKEIMQMQI